MITPTPTRRAIHTPQVTPAETSWIAREGTYLPRLHIGHRAYVTTALFLPGENMEILDDLASTSEWVWWYDRAEKDSLVGWTAEGDSENYWLVPTP